MTLFGNIKASHLFAQDGTKLQQLEEAVWAWVRLYVFVPRVPCYLTPDVCRVLGCYSYVWWWRPCRVHRRSKVWSASVQNTQVEPGSVTTPGTAPDIQTGPKIQGSVGQSSCFQVPVAYRTPPNKENPCHTFPVLGLLYQSNDSTGTQSLLTQHLLIA